MAVKRKSNWYIYLIAFGVTLLFAAAAVLAFSWYLFPEKTQGDIDPVTGQVTDNYKPKREENFNAMIIITDNFNRSPELFIMLAYNAVECGMTFIPLPDGISVKSTGRALSATYVSEGGRGVISAVGASTGVACESFVTFDRSAFINLATAFGNVEFNVPKTIVLEDDYISETIDKGLKMFSPEGMYNFMMSADFGMGEDYRFRVIGGMMSNFINQNYRELDTNRFDFFFNLMYAQCETNISEVLYKAHKPSFLYTLENGASPADYYVPNGTYTADGGFDINPNSELSIRQRAGVV